MIECRKISKIYRSAPLVGDSETSVETRALWNVSFVIEKGEFVAIIGPSGSGKSTLMNILGALDSPTDGQYLFEGRDVSGFSDNQLTDIRRNKIGFVFQSFNLLPRTSVFRNVSLPLVYAEVEREKRQGIVRKALFDAGLSESHFHHLSNQLSGGQMQRVAIARALVNDPSLILADEPTGNLDSKTGEIILNTFRELNRKGKTIVLITHEKYIAEHASRVITVKDGEIVEDVPVTGSKAVRQIKE